MQELVREAHVQQQRWPVDEEEPVGDAHASGGDAEDPMAVEEVEVAEELIKGLEHKRRRAHVVLENRRRCQSAQGEEAEEGLDGGAVVHEVARREKRAEGRVEVQEGLLSPLRAHEGRRGRWASGGLGEERPDVFLKLQVVEHRREHFDR